MQTISLNSSGTIGSMFTTSQQQNVKKTHKKKGKEFFQFDNEDMKQYIK